MVLFDNHNHSQFSFDGKRTSIEDSARAASCKNLGGIAFTDHCDFFVPQMKAEYEKLVPETFDIAAQQEEIDRIQETLDIKILKGIEIGMHEDNHADIRKLMKENSFDQVIASVHYLDGVDPYYGSYYLDKDWKNAYRLYLETIHNEMVWMQDFDIMGHFDYIVRYAPYPQTCMRYKDFSDVFDEMFHFLIHEGKALEINTKSYQDHHGREVSLDTDILLRYKELGGEIISLGSDSHDAQKVGHNFTYFAELLRSLGFRWTAHYENRKLVQLPV